MTESIKPESIHRKMRFLLALCILFLATSQFNFAGAQQFFKVNCQDFLSQTKNSLKLEDREQDLFLKKSAKVFAQLSTSLNLDSSKPLEILLDEDSHTHQQSLSITYQNTSTGNSNTIRFLSGTEDIYFEKVPNKNKTHTHNKNTIQLYPFKKQIPTWAFEASLVAALLGTVSYFNGGGKEWIGTAAVLITFIQYQKSLQIEEAQKEQKSIIARLGIGKDLLFFTYFLLSETYAPLVGAGIFLSYPAWRKWSKNTRNTIDTKQRNSLDSTSPLPDK